MLIARTLTSAFRCAAINPVPLLRLHHRPWNQACKRYMAAVVQEWDLVPHLERTANDARQRDLYNAIITRVEQVNKTIRSIRLSLPKAGPPVRHLPGQYVDLYIPNIDVVGGFTITSPPQTALVHPVDPANNQPLPVPEDRDFPYIELSIQAASNNPPAAYVWQDPSKILYAPVGIRIGGNFHHPPAELSLDEFKQIQNVVLVAGGVGINPVISMVSAMDLAGPGKLGGMTPRVRILYSSKRGVDENGDKERVLFEDRLEVIADRYRNSDEVDLRYRFFETSAMKGAGRITQKDLLDAVGGSEIRKNTLVYICGVPKMTDEFVDLLRNTEGLDEKRVLCEKWW